MRNRILTLLCSIMLLTVFMPDGYVYADSGYNSAAALKQLSSLGIYDGRQMNQATFVYSLAGFVYDYPEAVGTAEEVARWIGAVAEGEEYPVSTEITVSEALKYAVRVLGYQNQAISSGGYKNVAAKLKLTDGISGNDSAILSNDDAVRLLYNMLEVEPYVRTSDGIEIAENETLLSVNRNIYRLEGVMTSDERTSIAGDKTASDGCIVIDGEEYIYKSDAWNVLGRTVVAYAKEASGSDIDEIICIGEKAGKNKVLTINASDVESVNDSITSLEYVNNNGNTVTLKMPRSLSVIYNGKYYGKYTKADFMPDEGVLEFVDRNGDNTYETVFITAYEAMVVESVDTNKKIISGRYGYDGCIDEVKLEDKIYDIESRIYKGDTEITIADIAVNDVLSIAQSKGDGDKSVLIYVSEAAPVSAVLEGQNYGEDILIFNGEEHRRSREFMIHMTFSGKELEAGKEYVFFTDKFGKVIYSKTAVNTDYKVIRKFYQDTDNELYYGVYMNLDEEWKTAKLAKKVKYNGIMSSDSYVFGKVKNCKGEIVKIRENAEGEINYIETAQTDIINEDIFTKTSEATRSYRLQAYTLDYNFYLEETSYIVVIPEELDDKEAYKVYNARGFFSADKSYQKVAVYDSDEYGHSSMFTIRETQDLRDKMGSKSLFVVTGKVDKLVDGEVLTGVEGSAGSLQNFTLVGKNNDIFKDIKKGDIINVYVNGQGKTESASVVYNLDNFKNQALSNMFSIGIIAGTVEKIDIAEGKMIVNCGYPQRMKISATTIVSEYSTEHGITDILKATSLKPGDKIVFRSEYGVIKEIIRVN